MSTTPNLWPEELKETIRSPLAILRAQASALAPMTKGVLIAEVNSVESGDRVRHQLDVVAPALQNYRHRILGVEHEREWLYPARVLLGFTLSEEYVGRYSEIECTSDEQLIAALRKALGSEYVRSRLASLIIRSNEGDASAAPTS